MSEPLKPCPFCGSKPEPVEDGVTIGCSNDLCYECGTFLPTEWNRRAPNPLLPLVRELRDAGRALIPFCHNNDAELESLWEIAWGNFEKVLTRTDEAILAASAQSKQEAK
jgi:hypothetical protein